YFRFVESLPIAYFHVFPYSVRAGTTAAKLDDRVESAEIRRRAAALRELGEGKTRSFAARFVGRRLEVLLEEIAPDGSARGHSRNYLRVLTSPGPHMTNQEVEVAIESLSLESAELVGRVTGLAAGGDQPQAAQPS